ncbi:MAG TPA: serine/threonine-protein kinase [Gemmatimonadales bacterium]|nr:serine/threonine-protein kinase [Gemmatimonadales bacterium]
MADLQERLARALADRFDVRREIGSGGMATVFLAEDRRTGRMVAIKLFRPEIAMSLGAERFLREIDVAARMEHPHIVPLLESGQAEEGGSHAPLLWYSMPWIEGESLAGRLQREGELPLDEVAAIVRAVASALQHAHERRIVHRDVKPANILLSDEGPLVADFGIAHAIGQTGEQKLTSTGTAIGTAAYMSPEQAAGTGRLDGRSDIYALGCVAYEMLIGEPPFSGPTTQAVMSRHAVATPPSLRVVRPGLPPAVEAVVLRALAKSPADRFRSATEFADAFEAAARGGGGTVEIAAPPQPRRRWLVPALGALAVILGVLTIRPWALGGRGNDAALDPRLLTVRPFAVTAGADSTAAPLAAGLADLVVERLPGDDGPRGVRSGNAARVLQGALSTSGADVVLSATLTDAASGDVVARVDRVAGPRDSLVALLDRMLVELLVRGTGAPPEHVAALSGLPLAAARAWLGGHEAFLAGRFEDAAERYAAVLRADSTAYPAALGLAITGEVWEDDPKSGAIRLARAAAHRFSAADSILVHALTWNEPGRSGSNAERLAGFEDVTQAAPDRAERWYLLGERLFHDGPLLGLADVLERAAQSFRHAVEREPAFVPALGHLIDIAAGLGDTAEVRELGPRYLAASPRGDLADYYRWRVAVALGDSAALGAVRQRFDSMGAAALERVVNVVQLDGVDPLDAVRAAEALWARSGVRVETRWAFMKQRELALNRGRPAEASSILARQRASVGFRARDGLAEVVNALHWGADTAVPAEWVATVGPRADGPDAGRPQLDDDIHYERCGVGLWRAGRSDWAGARRAEARLRAGLGPESAAPGRFEPLCADLIAAVIASGTGAADTRLRLARVDSVAATAPATITWILVAANLTAARLWEREGDVTRAVAAVRRRPYIVDLVEPRLLVALSTMLAEEGRLAALAGDRAGAARAWRRYLTLRADAEPRLQPEVRRIEAELARIAQ